MKWYEVAFVALYLVNVGLQLASMMSLRRWRKTPAAPPAAEFPPVSVVTSLKGMTPQTEGGLKCILESDYPGELELVVVVSDLDDPVLAFAKDVVAKTSSNVSVRWVSGFSWREVGPGRSRNPRSAKMAAGIAAAQHDWIYWHAVDSWITKDHFTDAMSRAGGSQNKYVTSFPVIINTREFGSVMEAAALNIEVARFFLLSTAQKGGRAAYGGSLLAHRALLDRSGGLSGTLNRLTDDVILARQFSQQGAECVLSPKPVYVPQEEESLRDFLKRQVRWLMIARYEMPPMYFSALPFMLAPIGFLFSLGLAVSGSESALRVAVASAIYVAFRAGEGMWFQRELGTPRDEWIKGSALAIYDALLPWLWVAAFLKKRLDWAGDTLIVGTNGELQSAEAP